MNGVIIVETLEKVREDLKISSARARPVPVPSAAWQQRGMSRDSSRLRLPRTLSIECNKKYNDDR